MRTVDDKAIELITFYQSNIEKLYDQSHSKELARLFAMDHCDRMIQIVDYALRGWLDTDLVSYWKGVKHAISKC